MFMMHECYQSSRVMLFIKRIFFLASRAYEDMSMLNLRLVPQELFAIFYMVPTILPSLFSISYTIGFPHLKNPQQSGIMLPI